MVTGGAAGYWLFGRRPFSTDDPERVREVTRQIAEIDIPPALKPAAGGMSKGALSDRPVMAWVVYSDRSSKSYVALFSDTMARQILGFRRSRTMVDTYLFEKGFDPFPGSGSGPSEYIAKDACVRGRQVALHFWKWTDTTTRRTYLTLFDNLPGPTQDEDIQVKLLVDASKADEKTVIKMIESMR